MRQQSGCEVVVATSPSMSYTMRASACGNTDSAAAKGRTGIVETAAIGVVVDPLIPDNADSAISMQMTVPHRVWQLLVRELPINQPYANDNLADSFALRHEHTKATRLGSSCEDLSRFRRRLECLPSMDRD